MRVTILTPTGGRPEIQHIYDHCIANQTYKGPIDVLLIDDTGDVTTSLQSARIKLASRMWEEGLNTQRFSLEQGLKLVEGDVLFLCENDDYFAPTYIEAMLDALKHSEAVGISSAVYYNVQVPGYKTNANFMHSSLSQTALRRSAFPLLKRAIDSGEFYIDVQFWKLIRETKIPFTLISNPRLSLGIKGLPGKKGLTISHSQKKDYLFDTNLLKLEELLGDAVKFYKPFTKYYGKNEESPSGIQKGSSLNREERRGIERASGRNPR